MNSGTFWRLTYASLFAGFGLVTVVRFALQGAPGWHSIGVIGAVLILGAGAFEIGRISADVRFPGDAGREPRAARPEPLPEGLPEALPAEPIVAVPTQASEPPSDRREREWGDDELLDLLAEYEREEISQEALGERRALSGRRIGQLLKRAREIRAADARAGIPRSTNSGTA